MGPKRHQHLFRPGSVAVIGASERPGSLGCAVMTNLLSGQFRGPVLPVNRKYDAVQRVLCYRTLNDLPLTPDLALLCTPPDELEALVEGLGLRGTRLAVVMTNQLDDNSPLVTQLRERAQWHGMRLLGADSTGLQIPAIGLNASWISTEAHPGSIALLCESGSLASGIIEQAANRGIGFSHVITTGTGLDLDIAELLDLLILDSRVHAILMHLRQVKDARRFLSAARAAARIKPVILLNSGHSEQKAGIGPFHPGDIYDAAFRRAGMLQVDSASELFDAVETLAHSRAPHGERIALLGNGGGLLELAQDTLERAGIHPAALDPALADELRILCDSPQARTNPLNLGRGAGPERYRRATELLMRAASIDGLLVLHSPTPIASSESIAGAVVQGAKVANRNILACWMGDAGQPPIRKCFNQAQIPVYDTPEKCATAFLHLINHRRNQETLLQTPAHAPVIATRRIDRDWIGDSIEQACQAGRTLLNEAESADILTAYGLTVPASRLVRDPPQAVAAAREFGWPVALRLASPHLRQTVTVGNMIIDLASEQALSEAVERLIQRFHHQYPGQRFPGLVLQRMVRRPQALVLAAGLYHDNCFGALIGLGPGGIQRRLRHGHALALPPLNMNLAGELISRTHLRAMLQADDESAPVVDEQAIRGLLVQLSRLCTEQPGISGIEINPLLADDQGIMILDARIGLMPQGRRRRLAIRPYPRELEQTLTLRNGQSLSLRPIRPEDEPLYRQLLEQVTPEDLRLRFCGDMSSLPRAVLAQQIHLDYDREMTLLALQETAAGSCCLGTVNAITRSDNSEAEYAILVRSDHKGIGLGRLLMERIIAYCRSQGTGSLYGLVLKENRNMRALAGQLGFHELESADEDMVEVRLPLNPAAEGPTDLMMDEIVYP
ncbi:bifunctional acetate--CoA ligase family protein/GNAT family N-acetyltransferase [Sedimenticola hydrogenitrophicus]|uniref:bifunctional acetate--CoA ligase family protein/GNAT family N-acetyltransferase n=1 Tax=Sedimenticola hydrogenitrophicus TaxID=2967975 RepID=UPI0021A874AD|nr:bifunctional acetate--CoA ligase family protein/GNAT family N-acetyltransferase [Sedimenticola hydrogenitrophicus]